MGYKEGERFNRHARVLTILVGDYRGYVVAWQEYHSHRTERPKIFQPMWAKLNGRYEYAIDGEWKACSLLCGSIPECLTTALDCIDFDLKIDAIEKFMGDKINITSPDGRAIALQVSEECSRERLEIRAKYLPSFNDQDIIVPMEFDNGKE